MSSHGTAFEGEVAASFDDYGDTVRGWVRYELVRQNLGTIVSKGTLQVADIGGGTAKDAIWLAGLGHNVTIVEPGEDQYKMALRNISHSSELVSERITVIRGTAEDLLEADREQSFDLVLSHGVAMYQDDPGAFIANLVRLAKPSGYISLLEKGRQGAAAALRKVGKKDEAESLEQTHRFINKLGYEVWAFDSDELTDYLEIAGAWVVGGWRGVRSLKAEADKREVSEVSKKELASILIREARLGRDDDERHNGQMLHLIAQA